MKPVKLPAIFSGIKSRKDKSYRLEFDTRELGGSDASKLLDMQMTECWMVIAPTGEIDEKDIPAEKPDASMGNKTPSMRMRGVIYRLWEQSGSSLSSEEYYRAKMEHLIDLLKDKIS